MPTPALQPASIDTLISSMSFFSGVLLGVEALIIGVFGIIGAFLVWNGFVLRARAEKDLDRIDEIARKSEKIFAEYEQRKVEDFKAYAELKNTLISEAIKAKEGGKSVELTVEAAQKELEKIKYVHSNTSQRTFVAVNPTFPLSANPYVLESDNSLLSSLLTTNQDIQGRASIHPQAVMNLGTK